MKLRLLRIILALTTFSLLTLYFLDFSGLLPEHLFILAKFQFVPALLAGMFSIVGFLVVLTLLFGRIYCSVICPMGVTMDIITWIRKRFKPKMKAKFSKEKRILRLGILALVVLSYFGGVSVVLSLLDPYSAFGRMATHLFRPVYMEGNNLLAGIFNHFGNYSFYNVQIFIYSLSSFIIALATLVVIGVLAALYGRTWCNTICPVGTVLGYLSKLSLFKIRIDEATCTNCGRCEKSCKASCIDNNNQYIDDTRCVACFDCIGSCKQHSIRYGLRRKKVVAETKVDEPKRRFMGALAVTATAAATLPVSLLAQNLSVADGRVPYKRKTPLSPPGSQSAKRLQERCTACHLCVAKCPSNVLKPSVTEYGLEGFMQPVMDFSHGFCNYNCTICSGVCPNEALVSLSVEEKHKLQMGRVTFIMNNCVVFTDETSCGACSEHCPTQAVQMVPYKDSLTIPSVNPAICVGCGGCEYVCPALPFKAIHVEGNSVHLEAEPFDKGEKKEVALDGFGF